MLWMILNRFGHPKSLEDDLSRRSTCKDFFCNCLRLDRPVANSFGFWHCVRYKISFLLSFEGKHEDSEGSKERDKLHPTQVQY